MEHINSLTAEAEQVEAHVRENKEEVEKLSGDSKRRSAIRNERMKSLKARANTVEHNTETNKARSNSAK